MSIELMTAQKFVLRKFQSSDLLDLFILMNDQEVNLYLPWFIHNTLLDTKKYIKDVNDNNDYFYVIENKDNHHVIGYISLSHIDEWHIFGELEYALLNNYWGKGIICEVFDEFFNQIKKQHFEYIYAKCNLDNKRSERVLEKIGMTYIKSNKELWKPKNIPVTFQYYQLNIKDYNRI